MIWYDSNLHPDGEYVVRGNKHFWLDRWRGWLAIWLFKRIVPGPTGRYTIKTTMGVSIYPYDWDKAVEASNARWATRTDVEGY